MKNIQLVKALRIVKLCTFDKSMIIKNFVLAGIVPSFTKKF